MKGQEDPGDTYGDWSTKYNTKSLIAMVGCCWDKYLD